MLYLTMALIWLTLALVAFAMPRVNPEGPSWTFFDIPIMWIASVLCIYNLLHWWAGRRRKPDRRLLRPPPPHPVHPDAPVNPEFNFTDRPPPPT